MSISKEEWDWLKPRLCEGMTFVYSSSRTSKGWIGSNLKAYFADATFQQGWDIERHGGAHVYAMSHFKWPDGSEVVFFEDTLATNYSPVINKVKSLQRRFANKSLPKVKATPLPFPH